jgi:protein-tyrosine-phosphatase/DNA-binding transcriptional ArsR family regulator
LDADVDLHQRARRLAALADPIRLAIVDELVVADRSPAELRRRIGIESNLLANHLDALQRAGVVQRSRSSGDGRRRYVHLLVGAFDGVLPRAGVAPQPALFVCTRNSARSQLAAAIWQRRTGIAARSAGTHPAARIDAGAIAAARRAGLALDGTPQGIDAVPELPALVITVCDRAHEELDPPSGWLHWSVPDPTAVGTADAFDATVAELQARIEQVVA